MSKVSLRRLLSKLTALALSASPGIVGAANSPIGSDFAAGDRELDDDAPIDREHLDPHAAAAALARGLALALAELRPLSATQLAAGWALSQDPLRRQAIANALEWTFPLVGDGLVLDHLSRDPDPAIRVAIARAAWIRRPLGSDAGVLDRLAGDPDPAVRAAARR
jgi:hypothetical protein